MTSMTILKVIKMMEYPVKNMMMGLIKLSLMLVVMLMMAMLDEQKVP